LLISANFSFIFVNKLLLSSVIISLDGLFLVRYGVDCDKFKLGENKLLDDVDALIGENKLLDDVDVLIGENKLLDDVDALIGENKLLDDVDILLGENKLLDDVDILLGENKLLDGDLYGLSVAIVVSLVLKVLIGVELGEYTGEDLDEYIGEYSAKLDVKFLSPLHIWFDVKSFFNKLNVIRISLDILFGLSSESDKFLILDFPKSIKHKFL
jgi:hypothetical protein